MTQKKQYSAEFKAKVALEALKQKYTINQLSTQFSVHPNQIMNWKKQLTTALPGIFSNGKAVDAKSDEELKARLYQEIGQLKMELDWLKKKAVLFS
jgi:putative transposase